MPTHPIYIVDDDASLRRTMVRTLADIDAEVTEFECAEEFLDGYSTRPAGCVLLDLRLPGMNGLDLIERVESLSPVNPIVVVSGSGDIPSAVRAVKSGALDYVQKPFRKEQLLEVVSKAFDWIDQAMSEEFEFERLTPREREVLIAFSDGAPNKIVAARLGLSPRTVEMHRARIFKKLGVTNLAQALMRARDARIIS